MWKIQDWAGNIKFDGEEFESFEDARAAIEEEAGVMFPNDEESQEAYCEDMYAIEVDD